MPSSSLRREIAAAVVVGLVTLSSNGLLLADSPSKLSGRVLGQNGADPRPGVVVTLVAPASERAYRSSPTDARGAFTIDTAPSGNYALFVEAPEGAFLAATNVQLAPGVNRPVSLALKPGQEGEAPAESTAPAGQKRSTVPTWAKWVIAGSIVVGAAIVIDAVAKDEASAF